MWRLLLLLGMIGLAASAVDGESPAVRVPRFSLIVDPDGLSRVARAPGELPEVLEKAAQAGFCRVLASPVSLRAEQAEASGALGVKDVLAAAYAKKLKAWCLLPMFGTLKDLRSEQWSASRAGGVPLAGVPCYALPETCEALADEAKKALGLPGEGVFVLLDGPVVWPDGNAAARDYGYNEPVVDEYKRRYGSDARDAKPDSLEQMFFLRLKGEHLAAAVRKVAAEAHRRGKKMGLALPLSETNVRTAVHAYIDVEGLIRDKTLDEVAVLGGQRFNFLRWKVQADPAPVASIWVGTGPDGKGLRTTIGMVLKNATADGLVLDALAALAGGRCGEVEAAVQALEKQHLERERFDAAIAKGEFHVVAGVREPKDGDQATTHGVAQSFLLDKPASVAAVRLFVALRAAPDADVADLSVELRADREGKPNGEVLAAGAINPCALSADPTYSWAVVRFPALVRLEAGRAYWIYVSDTKGYVWRMDRKASYSHGNAWSRQYDYTKSDWVFEVLAEKER